MGFPGDFTSILQRIPAVPHGSVKHSQRAPSMISGEVVCVGERVKLRALIFLCLNGREREA